MALLEFGNTTLSRAVECETPTLSPFEIFPDFTADILDTQSAWLQPPFYDRDVKLLTITIQSFVIQMDGLTILVDSCVGDRKVRERDLFNDGAWNWIDKLGAAGVKPEDVDMVVCSHLHVDHVGWNTRLSNGRWVPTFPNARYLMSKQELAYWQSDAGRTALQRTGDYVADSVQPVLDANQADLVDENHRLNEKIWFEHTPGHTPGHMAVHVADGGEEVILSGDVMHHPLQLRYPDWSTLYCANRDQARATRKSFLNRYADTGKLILPAHFPTPTAGHICRHHDHYGFQFLGQSQPLV
jgi:glyoxylase-like metal-dependent hydrolase (beta-lactamase superfamily II)